MQYLCYIVNVKFTPAIFCAVCANRQSMCSLSVIQSLAMHICIGTVLHLQKKGFNCLWTRLYVINVVICSDLTSFQIESLNFQIELQIESRCLKSNLYISNRITKRVKIAIGICPSLQDGDALWLER